MVFLTVLWKCYILQSGRIFPASLSKMDACDSSLARKLLAGFRGRWGNLCLLASDLHYAQSTSIFEDFSWLSWVYLPEHKVSSFTKKNYCREGQRWGPAPLLPWLLLLSWGSPAVQHHSCVSRWFSTWSSPWPRPTAYPAWLDIRLLDLWSVWPWSLSLALILT